ncbi:MAG TPA: S8 family serine peptidase [Thermoanaerobaculia bacterium]|nr:S8 family serine peptidase [Thermoanaerobaculia bacterium]
MRSRLCALGLVALLSPIAAAVGNPETVARGALRLPESLPGEVIGLTKVVDEEGRVRLVVDSRRVRTLDDLDALRDIEHREQRARHGSLGPALRQTFAAMGPGDAVDVVIHPRVPDLPHLDKYEHPVSELMSHSHGLLEAARALDADELALRYSAGPGARQPVRHGLLTPPGVLRVDRATLAFMRFDPDIAAIELYREPQPTTYPIGDLVRSAQNPPPMPAGARGAGVNASTFELGIHPDHAACWGVAPPDVELATAGSDPGSHSNQVFALLVNGAPDATFHHHKEITFSTQTAQDYLVNHGIQTSSISYTRTGDASTYLFRVMDDFAYRWPFPVFTNPTANSGYAQEAHWQHYNGISVGNVRHRDNRYYELDGCTQTRNPDPIYGSPLPGTVAGDREMPHLVSPGMTPYPNDGGAIEQCMGWTPMWCGTSYSAPLANSMAANVISADSRMVNRPEAVKAALLLTAKNVERSNWDAAEDGRDGAGAISGSGAAAFAQSHTTVREGAEAVHGLATGSLNDADEGRVLSFGIRIPSTVPAGSHLRAVLTWTSNPDVNGGQNSLSDLDLSVGPPKSPLDGSYSLDDNVEIVDVPAHLVTPGALVPLRVHVVDTRIPAGARANFFYYAVGWTWVKDFFFHAPRRGSTEVGVATTYYYCDDNVLGNTDEATARQYCREAGYVDYVRYGFAPLRGGVHTWYANGSWHTSGNNGVCYLTDLLCTPALPTSIAVE